MNNAIVRIRFAIRYFRSSPTRAQKFKFYVEKEKIESRSLLCLDVEKEKIESRSLLWLDVETRLNSIYLILVSIVKF